MGGALASLAAAEIYLSKSIGADKIKLVTFGQPRTGNAEWATAMSRAVSGSFLNSKYIFIGQL